MAWPEDRGLPNFPSAVTDANPDSFWRFEDDLLDSVGSNDLALVAGTEVYTDGIVAGTKAVSLDGSTHYVATDYKGIIGQAAWSISAWMYATEEQSDVIVSWGDVTGTNYIMLYRRSIAGGGALSFYGGTSNGGVGTDVGSLAINTLYHVCITKALDDTLADILMYINGVLQSTNVLFGVGNEVISITSANDVAIGRRSNPASELIFTGNLDEIAIFPDVLTPTEALAIYQSAFSYGELGLSWKESTEEWVSADLPRSGSRYKSQLVTLSDQGKIHFGAI